MTDQDFSSDSPPSGVPDPRTEQIQRAVTADPELFSLLAELVEHGDPAILRVAETNLRSLVKKTRRSDIPWANREPGNFDPPSD